MNNQIIIKNSSNAIINNWVKTTNGNYCILDNNEYFTLNTTKDINCELIMIGGGGAGGYFYGGGGGAGCVYYDNKFKLEAEKKYKFNIGKGGNSLLNNIDEIFNNGLELQGFYNSKPNIDNFNITDNDISSLLNVNCKNNVLCPFTKNIINLNNLSDATNNIIDTTKNGYSLIWTGFLSVPVDGNYIFELDTEFLTYIWIDMYLTEYNKDNLFIQTGVEGINKRYSKELKAGVFYNFKMFVNNTNNTKSFSFTMKNQKNNINTENNTFKSYMFSLNKNIKEDYQNNKSTPTTLLIDNKEVIKCNGGGMGGYGLNLNEKNKENKNGGSGGGAGIDKIAGVSTNIKNENYYGFNGSAGNENYKCGGGGGSYSGGFDSSGGNGIEIDWLNNKIGIGGDGYILNEYKIPTKKNNYGSGGDGGGVFDKEFKLCGKSGTNGCVIIFIKSKNIEETSKIEHFANPPKKNIFDEYVENSYLKYSIFSNKYSLQEIKDKLIPCENNVLEKLYIDCLFYTHLYSALFIELEKFNKDNNYEVTKFKEKIKNLRIVINTTNTSGSNISSFDTNDNNSTFTLFYGRINANITKLTLGQGAGISHTTISGLADNPYLPILNSIFANISTFNISNNTNNNDTTLVSLNNFKNKNDFTKQNFSSFNDNCREYKKLNVLYEILSTSPENIMGYLLYYKVFYNIIVYNLSIQLKFRYETINNLNLTQILTFHDSTQAEALEIKNHITNMISNTKNLSTLTFPDPKDNEYLQDKSLYSSKIELLNNIKEEYNNNQILLNRAIKKYNDYLKNYEKLKNNAMFAIIFLIVLIVVSIIIFASTFDSSFKQTYNMVANTLLIITTFLYYNNFKNAAVYESFDVQPVNGSGGTVIGTGTGTGTGTDDIIDQFTANSGNFNCSISSSLGVYNGIKDKLFNNYLTDVINKYNKELKEIFDKLRTNMLTTGSKSYSTDGNKYLYNLFLEKKQKNEVYKNKRVNIINLIEVLKKQISYLFNIILLICLITIIAFFSLFMFNLFPHMLMLILIIASILLFIVCVYFIFVIKQPAHLVANKNYWANETPDQEFLSKL